MTKMGEQGETRFRLDEEVARSLARRFGTPLYVIDEAHFRSRIRRYQAALEAVHPESELVYACKANSTLAVLAIAGSEMCSFDVASEGELRAALAAGAPPERCLFHGNNKSVEELRYAMKVGVGRIVIDNFPEIDRIFELTQGRPEILGEEPERLHCPELLIRLAPAVDPITHERISTGQADTKFGFNIGNGAAARAVSIVQGLGLPLVGFHCHVGSQLLDPGAQCAGGEAVARFALDVLYSRGFWTQQINVGGGLGVRYEASDHPMEIEEYCRAVSEAISPILGEADLTPRIAHEPGRALIAESGVTLYKVGVVKTVPSPMRGQRTYVVVDGGLSDNPRPALYDARYTVEHIPGDEAEKGMREAPQRATTVSGKHCETDTLFENIMLPAEVREGDLLQVLCTGAYNSSMASNYNRFPRPATVLLRENGEAQLVQRRDDWEEMFAREVVPGDLRA